MAESKGGIFAKQLQKHIVRTKTKVLQNLGKADKTRDDELDIHLINFQKQQHDAARLQKDLRHFINCARDLGEASTVLQTTMYELYEEEWTGYDRLQNINESLELLWLDYVQRLNASVLPSLVNYANLFPDSKTKISKRGRKLTDYDNTKHNLEAMLAAKKKDDGKILKAQDECNESKRIYDELNNELHDELPALYDKRIGVYASTFHTLFASTTTMYGESAKLVSQLADLLETLTSEHDRGDFMPKQSPRQRPPRPASAVKRTPSQNESGDSAPSDDGHVTTNDTGEQSGDKQVIGSSTFYGSSLAPASTVAKEATLDLATKKATAAGIETERPEVVLATEESSDTDSDEESLTRVTPRRPEPTPRLSQIMTRDDGDDAALRAKANVAMDEDTVAKHTSEGTLDRQSRVKEWLQEKRKSEESSSAKSKASTLDSKLADDDGSDQSLNDADVEDALQQLDMNLDVEDVIEDHVEPPKINNDEKTEEPEPEPEPRTEPNPKPEPRGEAKPVTKADEAEPEPETKPVEQAKDEKAETEDVPLPHGVLYQVRVSHRYDKQEEDELQLEPGDILNVVQIEEEGWLLGYQVETKEEGVFPENFTKRK